MHAERSAVRPTGQPVPGSVLQDISGRDPSEGLSGRGLAKLEFDAGEFVKAQGRSNLYQGRTEIILDKIRRVMPDRDAADGFREEECIRCAPRPVDEMWAELMGRLDSVHEPILRSLLLAMVARHADRLRIWPAARTGPSRVPKRLLEHILKIMEVSLFLAEQYRRRRDLLIAGALLHDIGKLQELSYETATDYTLEGNLVGHIVIGVGMLRDAVRELAEVPDGTRDRDRAPDPVAPWRAGTRVTGGADDRRSLYAGRRR